MLGVNGFVHLFVLVVSGSFVFFFTDTATTEIYTLSLHDALPIWRLSSRGRGSPPSGSPPASSARSPTDRKSTRLNSSHVRISYAVFCLNKKTAEKTGALNDVSANLTFVCFLNITVSLLDDEHINT